MTAAPTPNPYAPGSQSKDGATPPWSDLIRRWVDEKMADVHVAMPCIVTMVKTNNRVDLQPLLKQTYKYATSAVDLPIIQDAFVGTPRGAQWFIKMPIAVGDVGMAFFTDASLDVFSVSGGTSTVDPKSARTHDISDAVFYPGLYPFTSPIPTNPLASPLDMILQNGTASLYLQPGGTFMAVNAEDAEAFMLLLETITAVSTLGTAGAAGSTAGAVGNTAMATAATNAASAATALATASTGPLLPLAVGFGSLATAFTALATAAMSTSAGSTATAAAFAAAAGTLSPVAALFATLVGELGE